MWKLSGVRDDDNGIYCTEKEIIEDEAMGDLEKSIELVFCQCERYVVVREHMQLLSWVRLNEVSDERSLNLPFMMLN